jgi:hypothetical protein
VRVENPTHWACPNCDAQAVTRTTSIPMHPCCGLHGLMVALVPEGQRVKVEALERQDYIGKEKVQTDGRGRPIMAVKTTRNEGEDLVVLAPCAEANARAEDSG